MSSVCARIAHGTSSAKAKTNNSFFFIMTNILMLMFSILYIICIFYRVRRMPWGQRWRKWRNIRPDGTSLAPSGRNQKQIFFVLRASFPRIHIDNPSHILTDAERKFRLYVIYFIPKELNKHETHFHGQYSSCKYTKNFIILQFFLQNLR